MLHYDLILSNYIGNDPKISTYEFVEFNPQFNPQQPSFITQTEGIHNVCVILKYTGQWRFSASLEIPGIQGVKGRK